MKMTYQTLVEKAQIDNGYFDTEIVSEEELKVILSLNDKDKKEYIKTQGLILNQDGLSLDAGKYYRRRKIELTDEQLMRLIIFKQGKAIESINLKMTILFAGIIGIMIIGFLTRN